MWWLEADVMTGVFWSHGGRKKYRHQQWKLICRVFPTFSSFAGKSGRISAGFWQLSTSFGSILDIKLVNVSVVQLRLETQIYTFFTLNIILETFRIVLWIIILDISVSIFADSEILGAFVSDVTCDLTTIHGLPAWIQLGYNQHLDSGEEGSQQLS